MTASVEQDAAALALLDRLLELDDPVAREAELALLRARDPLLAARVDRLWHASQQPEASFALRAGMAAGLGATLQAGQSLAGYRLLRELGRGGMSSVWLAQRAEGDFKREVALKLPHVHGGLLAERFARERDVLAGLDHPHIARLFDAGVSAQGQPFLVMEAVHGLPLTQYAATRGLDRTARLRLFAQVLEALQHAHARLVVHRDLKPDNILVDEAGQVKLLDFGIAKLLAPEAAALTQDASSVLTPRYAAPEQVLGQAVTTATDVYGAAVVLYELLTGRLPYGDAVDGVALLHAIAHGEPRPPALGPELDAVLLKALAREPADRYASIERLADDLLRVTEGRPPLARRASPWRRLWLLLRRQPRTSAAIALTAIALVGIGSTAWLRARGEAAQQARADAVRDFVFRMLADAEPLQRQGEVTAAQMVDAAVQQARRDVTDPRLRGELLGALGRVHYRLRHRPAAIALLDEAHGLLQRQAPPTDPMLNLVRADLALSLLDDATSRGVALAEQVVQSCPGSDCAKARAQAHYALAANATWQGREAEAWQHAEASLADTEVAFKAGSPEVVAALHQAMAVALNQGQLGAAQALMDRAEPLARQQSLRAGERARLDLIAASLQAQWGHYEAARAQLQAVQRDPGLADAWYEQATQWRTLASIELASGNAAAAQAAAASAVAVLPPAWRERAQAWIARGQSAAALSLLGRQDEAIALAEQTAAGLRAAGYHPSSARLLAVARVGAEAQWRRGDRSGAAERLHQALRVHAQPAHPIEAAQVLDDLGCLETQLGRPAAARSAFEAADLKWASQLPPDHPLRQRHAGWQAGSCP